ncbi:MAG: hypothetical protein NXY59_00315 [Aigarchaeota archaeon]|nr:hypothetical protein [Candidatus Pelearchaeum maunauluense]
MRSYARLRKLHLYADPSSKTLNPEEIAEYLREKLPALEVDVRQEFFTYHAADFEHVAPLLAAARIRNPLKRLDNRQPLYGEVEYEKSLLKNPSKRPLGILYDGFMIQAICHSLLKREENNLSEAHIIFTGRLLATYGEDRYHIRVIICGYPSLISTTGIVEGPAKPREFYIATTHTAAQLTPLIWEEMKQQMRGRFIEYDDERLTEVMKGYVLQAVFYQALGEAFCDNKHCRLYNSHWQEEVLEAQLAGHELCNKHRKMLELLQV